MQETSLEMLHYPLFSMLALMIQKIYTPTKQMSASADENKGWLSRGQQRCHRLLVGYRYSFMLMQPEGLEQHITLAAHHRWRNKKPKCIWRIKPRQRLPPCLCYWVKELQHPLLLVKWHCTKTPSVSGVTDQIQNKKDNYLCPWFMTLLVEKQEPTAENIKELLKWFIWWVGK